MPQSQRITPSVPSLRAKVVRVGNSVGVRLPANLHLKPGDDVEITIRPVDAWPEGYFDMQAVGADFILPERESGEVGEERIQRLFGKKGEL
jgi:hypothetical protein